MMSKQGRRNHEQIQTILESLYQEALHIYYTNSKLHINALLRENIDVILKRVEQNKGVLTVLITLLVYKLFDPNQNIKLHRADLEGGFSGRSIDTKYVTPFLKSKGFPAMRESGWLTRSLEHPHPYDFNYPGKIKPKEVKYAFLSIIHEVQDKKAEPRQILLYIFIKLLQLIESESVKLPRPKNLTIEEILKKLESHFNYKYLSGRSRLPVLAIYAIYKILINEVKRYEGKKLSELLPHESPDEKTGMLGDIQIIDNNGKIYEVIEVKDRVIDKNIVLSSIDKIKSLPPEMYYILTTSTYEYNEELREIIKRFRSDYGTTIIINGVLPTIKYYLRLIKQPSDFIEAYVELLEKDSSVKREHREAWKNICSE